MDALELTKKLIEFPSVTPNEAGCLNYIENLLTGAGFKCERMKFAEVDNLYAIKGQGKNFCFAGHIDVVPPGDFTKWKSDPFKPEIREGKLYGRGASDMKAAVAASIIAAMGFKGQGAVSLLLTADEEGPGINGTAKVLEVLAARGEKIAACIVGEPTSVNKLGDMAKIGRRGSMNCKITINGKQGHAAYPHLADNPVRKLVDILHRLQNHKLDSGSEHFQPSNLEIVTFDVGNPASNVIPAKASAVFNIRFNDQHKSDDLKKWIEGIVSSPEFASANSKGNHSHATSVDYSRVAGNSGNDNIELSFHVSGESFLTKPGKLSEVVKVAVKEVTGIDPELSTTGGTSDARFISKYSEVVEFGIRNATAHQVDEHVDADDINKLAEVYAVMLKKFFA